MSRARPKKSPPRSAKSSTSPAAPPRSLSNIFWVTLAVACLAVYALLALQPKLLFYLGVAHYNAWFLDTYALLASADAWGLGLKIWEPNPLDVFQRPHVYSHWWLYMHDLGLTRWSIYWLGAVVDGAFFICALKWLRPRSEGQWLFYFAALVSPPLLLALDRANNDLIIFVLLTPLASCLLSPRRIVRFIAPLLVVLAAGLKYFPAAAGLVLLADAGTIRERRLRLALTLGVLVLVALNVAPDLAQFGPIAPQPEGWASFGAASAFRTLGWTGRPATLAAAGLGALVFIFAWRSRRLADWTPRPENMGDWLRFVLGGVLLAGCFFTSANFSYRWVFGLWMLPMVWTLAHDSSAPRPARTFARLTQWLLIASLWIDSTCSSVVLIGEGHFSREGYIAYVKWGYFAEQPLTWAFFACVLVFLARFTKGGLAQIFAREPPV